MSAPEALAVSPTPSTPQIPLIWGENKAIRADLCGPERLYERARTLAGIVRWKPGSHAEPLLRRLQDNHLSRPGPSRNCRSRPHNQETLTADAEWLLDNYYIIADVLRQVQHDLPRGYYAERAQVVSVEPDGKVRIHYEGWDARWDETVPRSRLQEEKTGSSGGE
jgi:hypothetical protein